MLVSRIKPYTTNQETWNTILLKKLRIPMNQREYSWEEKELTKFLDNNLLELKTELKQAYDPFRTEGYVIVPKNLYSEKEILEQQKKSDKFRFDYTKLHTDDEPSEPRDEIAVLTESDEE